jgi:SAM-dependent methyltransferase
MLERALRTGRVQSTILADASKTGLADCCAELVIAANLLQVCDDPISILDEAWRLLRPGGGLVLFWPSDGATLTTAFAADLHLGRRVPQAALAALGRLAVGLAGVAVGARRRSGGSIASAVDAWATNTGARLTAAGEVARIQTHVTFFKPGHCG